VDVLGSAQNRNVQGEDQQKLDILANEALKNAMKHTGRVCVMASEEDEEIIGIPPEYPAGKYAVCSIRSTAPPTSTSMRPSAPSQHLSAGEPRGTRHGGRRAADRQPAGGGGLRDLRFQHDAGVHDGQGVHGFTLDPTIGEFLLSHPDIVTPPVGKYYSVNESHFARWDKGTQMAVRGFHGDLPELIKARTAATSARSWPISTAT
jgi:fructose-1,6-bisphosphatase I